jgi:hypothetical protein
MTVAENNFLLHELFVDDVYRAKRVFRGDQVWIDAGCHIGLFTDLATAHGAQVLCGIDSDQEMVDRFEQRTGIPAGFGEILEAGHMIDTDERFTANALKLDIQGAEIAILNDARQVEQLAQRFNTLLVEYHEPETLLIALGIIQEAGYRIDFVDAAVDALTKQDTYIIHALRNAQ